MPPKEGDKGSFLPFPGAPPAQAGCVGFSQCQLSAGQGRGVVHQAPVLLPPYCHLPLGSWRQGQGEGKASSVFGFAVFVGTLQLQRLPPGSQGARGRGQ